MRSSALGTVLAFTAGVLALPVLAFAGDPPAIASIGPYEAVDATPKQLLLVDRGSVDWVDGNLRAVFLVLQPGDPGAINAYLLRIRADCKTYDMAQMEQTMLDASGQPTRSDMLGNEMKPTPDGTVGHEMATAACDGPPKNDDGNVISFDDMAATLDFGRKFLNQ